MMNNKLNDFKNKALQAKLAPDDYTSYIEKYKQEVIRIQNEFSDDNEKVEELRVAFEAQKQEILSQHIKGADKAKQIKEAFVEYMISKAKLNRIWKSIFFFENTQAKYLEITIMKKESIYTNEVEEVKKIEHVEKEVVSKRIQLEAKKMINSLLSSKDVNIIMGWLDPYTKIYAPTKKKIFGEYFNVYTPNGFLEVQVEQIQELEKFVSVSMPEKYPAINALFKNLAPEHEERSYFINWLSYIFNTSRKTRNTIAFLGMQGTGKGVLQEFIIEYAIHRDNCYTVTNQDIASSFNGYLENRLFLVFNEIKGSFNESSTQADKIKPFITDSAVSVNDKHKKQVLIDNYANCLFFSNHDLPFQIEDKDRRYSIIKTQYRTLTQVAEEDFNMTINEFLEKVRTERDDFIIELKMVKYNEDDAIKLLDNEAKEKIKEQTNTTKEVIKNKLLDKDVEWFADTIDGLIENRENDKLIKGESQKVVIDQETQQEVVIKTPDIFEYTNIEFKKYFIDEIKQGVFTNQTLLWFTKLYEIDMANSLPKFGKFWNQIINKAKVHSIDGYDSSTSIKLRAIGTSQDLPDEVSIFGEVYKVNGQKLSKEIPF